MARGDDLEERLIDFAVRVMRVGKALPETAEGRHIVANYCAPARRQRQITAKREAPKAIRTLFTSYGREDN